MRHRKKVTQPCNWMQLVRSTNPKTGRTHYSIKTVPHNYFVNNGSLLAPYSAWLEIEQEWADHFDPYGSRGSRHAHSWKYRNRDEAEKLITIALMKWGDHYGSN